MDNSTYMTSSRDFRKRTAKQGRRDKMISLPFWIYIVVAGIFFSGFMAIRAARKDHEQEQGFIAQEGEAYMERLKEEKERRKTISSSS
jgi:heme/copper-type cytochrome/quinol oxidase subunit 3